LLLFLNLPKRVRYCGGPESKSRTPGLPAPPEKTTRGIRALQHFFAAQAALIDRQQQEKVENADATGA